MPNNNANGTDDDLPTPTLVKAAAPIGDRRILMLVIVIPYVFAALMAFCVALFGSLEEAKITLASSVFLGPLGALAGVIVAFYFKTND